MRSGERNTKTGHHSQCIAESSGMRERLTNGRGKHKDTVDHNVLMHDNADTPSTRSKCRELPTLPAHPSRWRKLHV